MSPCLILRGMWLERFNAPVGGRVVVGVAQKRIILTLDETPIPVPDRHQDHAPNKKRWVVRVTVREVLE